MCCFPLVINGFCSNNSFYSASLSFAIYFEADLSLLLITKALLRKQLCNVVPCEFTFVSILCSIVMLAGKGEGV